MMDKIKQLIAAATGLVMALVMAVALLAGGLSPAGAADILKAEQVFRYTVTPADDALLVRWTIEPAHYMYKERMGFESRTPGVALGEPALPAGIPYTDEYFGDMHIYRDVAEIRVPITSRTPGVDSIALALKSQGCSDKGLCYPPQVWVTNVSLPAASGGGGRLGSLIQGLRNQTSGAPKDEPLPVDQAFRHELVVVDPFTLQVRWTVTPGYYLYRHTLGLETDSRLVELGPPDLPPGTPQVDEEYGETLVFFDNVAMTVPLQRASPAATTLPLTLRFQGCKTDSICYPPQTVALSVSLPEATGTPPARPLPPAAAGDESEQDRLFTAIRDGNILAVMALFAGLGLLLSFTPCCLPMYPILSGIIVGQGNREGAALSNSRSFMLSVAFVLGMALTYTILGAVFAAAGAQVQAVMQHPAVIVGVALLFVALALSMFGLFDLQIPSSWQTRLNAISGRQKSGSLMGAGVMGVISAAVITTCVTPPLVAALTVIARTGDVGRGALALFALAIGMGLPLLAIGASAGRLLPKAGAWMVSVKAAFGLIMLAMAVWMLDRLWPGTLTLALWAVLLVIGGVFLGAFAPVDSQATLGRKLGKGFGIVSVLYGAALLIGALAGNEDPLRPLQFSASAVSGGAPGSEAHAGFTRIKTVADLDFALAQANQEGRPLLLDFYADWCASCKEMEKYTFPDPSVRAALEGAVVLQADVTKVDAEDQALMQRFGIIGPPTIMFFTADGREQTARRIVGFKNAADFAAHVRAAFSPLPSV